MASPVRKPPVRKPKDLIAGLLFLAVGLGALVLLREYDMGRASRMGPGYVPVVISGMLLFFAAILIFRSLRGPQEVLAAVPLQAPLAVIGGVLLFALLLRPAGLVLAVIPMVLLGMFSISRTGILSAVLTAAILSAGSVLVFVYALGQPIPVLGYWFKG